MFITACLLDSPSLASTLASSFSIKKGSIIEPPKAIQEVSDSPDDDKQVVDEDISHQPVNQSSSLFAKSSAVMLSPSSPRKGRKSEKASRVLVDGSFSAHPYLQLISSHLFHRGFTTEFLFSLIQHLKWEQPSTKKTPLKVL